MDTLSMIFGSNMRLRMLRLFLFNPGAAFDLAHVCGKIAGKKKEIEKEIALMRRAGIVKPLKLVKYETVKKGKKSFEKKVKVRAWSLDPRFKYLDVLTDFLVKTHTVENKAIVRKLERAGKIKAVLVSGIFMRDPEARLDMFVVGDNIKSSSFDRIMKSIESDMGKDIRYAVLSAPDFAYRKSMNDKLVRDVLDYPHTVLVDKIGIAAQP